MILVIVWDKSLPYKLASFTRKHRRFNLSIRLTDRHTHTHKYTHIRIFLGFRRSWLFPLHSSLCYLTTDNVEPPSHGLPWSRFLGQKNFWNSYQYRKKVHGCPRWLRNVLTLHLGGGGNEQVYLTIWIATVVGCGGGSEVAEFKGLQYRQCGCFGNTRYMYLYLLCFGIVSFMHIYSYLLLALRTTDHGFESHRGHGYLSIVIVVCFQVQVSATSWSLVQRSPTDCGASLCVI
jgi:hypothetical protein